MGWKPDPVTPLLNRVMFMFVDLKYSINHVHERCSYLGYYSVDIERTIEEALHLLKVIPPEEYPEKS